MNSFGGSPPELFAFFEGLHQDNSKDYWNASKTVWHEQVREPMLRLLDERGEEFGPMRTFRPNRDMRFAQDTSPYKLWAGASPREDPHDLRFVNAGQSGPWWGLPGCGSRHP